MRFFIYLIWRAIYSVSEFLWVVFVLAPLALVLLPIAFIGEWVCDTKIQYDLRKAQEK